MPHLWQIWGFVSLNSFTFRSNLGPLILESDVLGSTWDFFRSNNCCLLTAFLGPFLSNDCITNTLGSLWWSTMTNNLDLQLSWILLQPLGWSLNSTKFPTGIWRVLPPVLGWFFLALCLMFFNAYLFALISNSCCSFNHAHLLVESWSLYWAKPSQASQMVGTFCPNMTSYSW